MKYEIRQEKWEYKNVSSMTKQYVIEMHLGFYARTVQNLKKKELFVLSLFSVPHDLFWPDLLKSLAKISQRPENRRTGQNNLWYCH